MYIWITKKSSGVFKLSRKYCNKQNLIFKMIRIIGVFGALILGVAINIYFLCASEGSEFLASCLCLSILVPVASSGINIEKVQFIQWFVGFSDGESSFSIVPKKDDKGKINRFTFMFSIGLHQDDIDVLYTIQKSLGIGKVRKSNNECKFTVNDIKGIQKLIAIFDKYSLNTTKYLDYIDFKEAFNLEMA
jgi:hypothetical protein